MANRKSSIKRETRETNVNLEFENEELEIIRSQPWNGSPAIFASEGLFSFGAHIR